MQNENSIDCDAFANITLYGVSIYTEGLAIIFQHCKERNQWVVKCLCFGFCCQIQILEVHGEGFGNGLEGTKWSLTTKWQSN